MTSNRLDWHRYAPAGQQGHPPYCPPSPTMSVLPESSGFTESPRRPNVTMSPWDGTREHRLATIGLPQLDTEIVLIDPASGDPAPQGQAGEIVIRGYGVMQGYYGKPEETASAIRDGWLRTGDLAVERHDGRFTFAGRIKDIVRVGGENVSCAEVENALYSLGGVELASVPETTRPSGTILGIPLPLPVSRPRSSAKRPISGATAGFAMCAVDFTLSPWLRCDVSLRRPSYIRAAA